jgi:hypothetical protein
MGVIKSLAAELTPEWLAGKEDVSIADPREDTDKPPMPDPNWKPEVEKTPLDPKEDEDDFDRNRDDIGDKPSDPREGFTPKP